MPTRYGNMYGIIVYVKKETYEKLKKLAETEQRSLTAVVRAIIEKFFDNAEEVKHELSDR